MGKLYLKTGNILDDEYLEKADAIVNPTNPMMRCGAGVSGLIFKKAGVDILEQYTEKTWGISYNNPIGKNEMKVTEVRVTPGFGIPCDIIFAQGPRIWDYDDYRTAEQVLINTYAEIFMISVKKSYKNILMPALGTGDYGFSHEKVAPIVMSYIGRLIHNLPFDIYYVLTDSDTKKIYENYL